MPNRLALETSPYLQQHAENPVEWYPWGEDALAAARAQDKPILLSIGYSACHWCHVMAHESFEDPAVAAVMNRHFINVKVDREERPDIDQIYQTAHQLFNQRGGGWPLTAFLTPDETPFFVGTYFPKEPRYGRPGFVELLERIARAYREQRDDIGRQNDSVRRAFARIDRVDPGAEVAPGRTALDNAVAGLVRAFDPQWGGFGGAPKFPHPTDIELLMRRHVAGRNEDALRPALVTLEKMAAGGIYDHLGGGFCRYSVDERWMIPHFEKMLYDNGPLLRLYADAFALTGNARFRSVAQETAAWMMREMQSPEGGYYSSLDADSEGTEGKFYVWTPRAAQSLLTQEEYAVFARHYGLDGTANFEGRYWHLHEARPLADVASELGCSEGHAVELVESARQKLFAARERRARPGRDEKILTSWNALAIRGMARAAAVFGNEAYLESARRALDFLRGTTWQPGTPTEPGRLLATYKDGRAHLNAYLDDYAFLLAAALELMQIDFRPDDLVLAQGLADALIGRFEDREAGGFFFTSHDHEQLIHRPKPGHDNATPSGNATAAFVLQRLGHALGETRYLDAAARCLRNFARSMEQYPGGYATMLMALEEHLEPTTLLILRGAKPLLRSWQRDLLPEYRPHAFVLALDGNDRELPAALAKPTAAGRVNAYVCRGVVCLEPVSRVDALRGILGDGRMQ